MSLRSEQFMDQARDRVAMAQEALASGAATPRDEDAKRYVDGAAKFVAAVEQLLDA